MTSTVCGQDLGGDELDLGLDRIALGVEHLVQEHAQPRPVLRRRIGEEPLVELDLAALDVVPARYQRPQLTEVAVRGHLDGESPEP